MMLLIRVSSLTIESQEGFLKSFFIIQYNGAVFHQDTFFFFLNLRWKFITLDDMRNSTGLPASCYCRY